MSGIEWRGVSPEEIIRELEETLQRSRENKYAFQVGLKDVDFDINEEKVQSLGISLPFQDTSQAEQALQGGVILPTKFIEIDDTEHAVLFFDPRPVGYSGFMDCVTHSLTLTDFGLFEVGRYPAVNLNAQNRYWQWFLHRQLATPEGITDWRESQHLTPVQFVNFVYQAMVMG